MRFAALVSTLILASACGDDGGSGTGSTDSATSSTGGSSTSGSTSTATSTATGSTSGFMGECLLFEQDCSDPSQKCMPWSLEEDRIPDDIRCCPLDATPAIEGEECVIDSYDGSCVDDCDGGSACVLDRPDTLQGYCHDFCDPLDEGSCDADQTCKAFFEMVPDTPVVPICMEQCDPLLQDCDRPDWACIPDTATTAGMSGFICSPPPPTPRKQLFETCALANDCEAGLVCVPSDRVPDCNFLFCCTQLCSNSGADPCPALDPSLQCVDWMSADPKWTDVGACVIPL